MACTVALSVTPFDISSPATRNIAWDAIYNNLWDYSPLSALPDGLGLTGTIDGTDGTLTTAVAGVWLLDLSLVLEGGADPDLLAAVDAAAYGYGVTSFGPVRANAEGQVANVGAGHALALPAGATMNARIVTYVASLASEYVVAPTLTITRVCVPAKPSK